MAKFISCSCENAEYKFNKMHNSPVNIDLVTQVQKIQEYYYPDNEGAPAIHFHGVDKKWVYGRCQVKERDADYDRIVSNKNKSTKPL
jgi:hypothetical protein